MFSRKSSWILCLLALLLINGVIAYRLAMTEYTGYMNSNEGTFIALSKALASDSSGGKWWPLWACGIPSENTYLPFLQEFNALLIRATGLSAARAFHASAAFFFCLGPVGLFMLCYSMTRRPALSFLASAAFSVLSPSLLLSSALRADAGGLWNLQRLHILVFYGEGPQTAALALVPITVFLLYKALITRSLRWWIPAGLCAAAIALTNAFGAVTLGMGVLALLCSIRTGRAARNAGAILAFAVLVYCLISPLMPPSLLQTIRLNSPTVDGDYRLTQRSVLGLAGLILGYGVLWTLCIRRRVPDSICFFTLWAYLLMFVTMMGLRFHVYALPQPHRYQLGMDAALSVAVVLIGAYFFDKWSPGARKVAWGIGVIGCTVLMMHDRRYAAKLIRPFDITQTIEYRNAVWLDSHLKNDRVMMSGSNAYWYNVFTGNPQLHGGHDPFVPNPILRTAVFILYSGFNAGARDAEISVLWLKAFGVHAITMSGPGGKEYYKPFANPRKFEGVLPVLWRDGDDTIYSVPQRSKSLARIIPAKAKISRVPIHGLDVAELEAYVAAIDDTAYPETTFAWKGPDAAQIEAEISGGHLLSLQITYDARWRAFVSGHEKPIMRDGIGLMLIDPACSGKCTIALTFDGGVEGTVTRLLCGFSVIAVASIILTSIRKKRQGGD